MSYTVYGNLDNLLLGGPTGSQTDFTSRSHFKPQHAFSYQTYISDLKSHIGRFYIPFWFQELSLQENHFFTEILLAS